MDGEILVKADETARYGVNERSILRNIDAESISPMILIRTGSWFMTAQEGLSSGAKLQKEPD